MSLNLSTLPHRIRRRSARASIPIGGWREGSTHISIFRMLPWDQVEVSLDAGGLDVLRSALRWAAILGVAGFAGGFFGPMIFAPGANQGPMLGIFITGPGGVVLGFLLGLILGFVERQRFRI